jgi:Zn-dependent protease with chaperone function
VDSDVSKPRRLFFTLSCYLLWALSALGQQALQGPQIPPDFNLDLETAARLRSEFKAQSVAATGRYATGRLVFERLIEQVPNPSSTEFAWDLRIIEDHQLNAYSSPDGAIYVESGLAQLAGQSAGLWAAVLSHEIAHVVRRDWARRYLYRKSLESEGTATIVLGDPGLPSASWISSQKASEDLSLFCRQLEIGADRDSLMLMARAGYHPDFVPALHHLLHAQSSGMTSASLYAMHPCWEERDRELMSAYVEASIEFGHRWLEWYASPGGNPPIVVFSEAPTVRKTGPNEWQVQIPMRCENLAGAVEVVLRAWSGSKTAVRREQSHDRAHSDFEVRQLTGCTSPRTTVTLTLTYPSNQSKPGRNWANVYVLDGWGAVLGRVEIPKLPH